jgi:hypothetical protein
MGYREVLNLPINAFWSFVSNLEKIAATEDLRMIRLMAASQSSDGVKSVSEDLAKSVGEVVKAAKVLDLQRDEIGFKELIRLSDL